MRFLLLFLLLLTPSVQAQLNPTPFSKGQINTNTTAAMWRSALGTVAVASNGLDFADMNLTRSNLAIGNLSRIAASFGTNSYGGDMSNATPIAPFALGISYSTPLAPCLWIAGSGAKGDWKRQINFPGGIAFVGDPHGEMDDTVMNTSWYMGYGTAGQTGNSDTLFKVDSGATSPGNSGAGFNVNIQYIGTDGKAHTLSDNSVSLMHVSSNKVGTLAPANATLVFNRSAGHLHGLYVGGPGISGFDPGNYSLQFNDLMNGRFRIPRWRPGIYQPGDTNYTFTVSGLSVAPVFNSIYSHNGNRWTVTSVAGLSGSAPNIGGTIKMVGNGGNAPTSSGTLTKQYLTGDSAISFSSVSVNAYWEDSFYVLPSTGLVVAQSNLYVLNGEIRTGATAESGGGWPITVPNEGRLNGTYLHPTNKISLTTNITASSFVVAGTSFAYDGVNGEISLRNLGNNAGVNVRTATEIWFGNAKIADFYSGTPNGSRIFAQQCVSDTGAATPVACSILEARSTSRGFLLPRMTKAQRDAISTPVAGLAVFQTDNTPGLRVYNGVNWMRFTETID